jgi:hypothetical protein
MQRLVVVRLLDAATMGWPCSPDGKNREGNQSLEHKNNGIIFCKLCFMERHGENVSV